MIGVIGGNGVAATNKLQQLIEEELTKGGCFRDCQHPEMIIYQATQAPSRSMYLEGRVESFIPDYIKIGKKLKEAGANSLCMCCNTAHYAIDELRIQIGLPFIDLIECVVKTVGKSGYKRVGVMCSDGCRSAKIYDKKFYTLLPDVECFYPPVHLQKMVTRGICNVKNIHRFDEINSVDRPYNLFNNVYEYLIDNGADVVIAGCTDIRVDFKAVRCLDSLELLAKEIILETQR